jgi:phosphinothricin acetyltransferase
MVRFIKTSSEQVLGTRGQPGPVEFSPLANDELRLARDDREVIRPALSRDAAAIAAIYNQGIEERNATFETCPRTAADFADLRSPFLVAEEGDVVSGWARLARQSPRECYAGVGEASIYVALDARGRGLGRALFEALVDQAARDGFWKIVGGLFPENEASVALCHAAACREVGVFRRHSRLDGEWRDVLYVERLIGDAQDE